MRNDIQSLAIKSRDAHTGHTCRAVHYKMHEGSGLVLADALGVGPNFAISAGTPLATNVGWFTPPSSNSTVYAQVTQALDTAGYLQELFDFSQPYSNILIGLDIDQGNDTAGINTLLSMGKASTTTTGFLVLQANAGEVPVLQLRGCNASATTSITIGSDLSSTSRTKLLVDIARTSDNTVTVSGYINGVLSQSGSGDWSSNSGTAPLGSAAGTERFGDGFILGANVSGSIGGAKTAYMNAGAGENTKIRRFSAYRLSTSPAGIAQSVALDLYRRPGEFPMSLRGL